ncbi:hypothetical protein AR158_c211L [Paramecium bursaria Chlorella virus AR158]|uniref:hypothetical protein n=1 Tax=Paramecium bursaria Chlorella virus AR158 TaxID=380598 RepID=UPI00015AA871|nr:hypothetical protein AR158_c211L [Paramecium bursaria Chlorella virus AR158]ABU43757.1 hypothetical protein AR158_c211L [Paramecium bursaria Chlorella virus AR158]
MKNLCDNYNYVCNVTDTSNHQTSHRQLSRRYSSCRRRRKIDERTRCNTCFKKKWTTEKFESRCGHFRGKYRRRRRCIEQRSREYVQSVHRRGI